MVRIYNARDVMEAQEIVDILKGYDISAFFQNSASGVVAHDISGFGLFGVDVFVDESDENKASKIISGSYEH